MTTFAELKTQAAALLSDPSNTTFDDTDLGYFINAGIAQVSRAAPQKFVENVSLVAGTLSYPVRGGTGNLLANPSFEEGDESMFEGEVAVTTADTELLGGWTPSATISTVKFVRSSRAVTGQYIGRITQAATSPSVYLYQDIPVNPGSTYYVSGWHWKSVAGGQANVVSFDTLDGDSATVTAAAVAHSTTSGTADYFSGSITVPDDNTVAYIRVILKAYTESVNTGSEGFSFEDISLTEENTSLVATNALESIEIRRVEVWSSDLDPTQKVGIIQRGRGDSESGWDWWDGRLSIPARWLSALSTSDNYLRVWGYAPYDKLVTDSQVTDLSFELEQAVLEYVKLQALERLNTERDLFTQWQTRTSNSDISPAGLMGQLAQAREQWRRTKRDILVLREGQ